MKKIILLFFVIINILHAQDSFEEWRKKQNESFTNWKSQQDKEFSEFLKKGWDYYKTEVTIKQDTVPKPEEIPNPVDQVKPDLSLGKEVKVNKVVVPQPEVTDIVKDITRNQMLYAVNEGNETARIDYWGIKLTFSYNKNMIIDSYSAYDSDNIADYWSKISNTDYEELLKSLNETKDKFVKNDWGFCQLLYKLGEELYQDENMANLFTWFVLTKNGYDAKVGYNDNNIFLLLAVKSTVYNVPRMLIKGRDYYCVSLGSKKLRPLSMYTYSEEYPEADDLIDLSLSDSPYLNEVLIERLLKFEYNGKIWTIPVKQNKTLVEFLESYPATDLDVYFQSRLSPLARASLVDGLKPVIEGKTETEALNILLHFVQTAFQYQTDDQQFGKENSLFPDETLYYEYCDCEDRSFLFSYLVEELLGKSVIGLDYPGHIATAVEIQYQIEGDKIFFDGKNYLVCDPTYINADIGVVMPQFLNVEPRIIQFR